MRSWSREIGPLLLATLADTFTEWAFWEKGGGYIKGRWMVDPFEVPTGPIEPGVGEIQTWFRCDRRVVPKPLPELGDLLEIAGQTWEIVQRDEDDLGELAFRLIKQELGLLLPEAEPTFQGDWDDKRSRWDQPQDVPGGPSRWDQGVTGRRPPGRPSRRAEITDAFNEAATAGVIGPDMPMSQVVETVRERIVGGDRRGLGDKTLRRTVGPLVAARRGRS